jgi:molecular chaperone DnaK (HSP70)
MATALLSPDVLAGVQEAAVVDTEAHIGLRYEAEQCKIALSTQPEYEVRLDDGKDVVSFVMDTADLQQAAEPFLQRLWAPLQRLGEEYHLEFASYPSGCSKPRLEQQHCFAPPPRRVTQLILVGGVMKSPIVRQFVEDVVGCTALTLGDEAEFCVALGAAVHAGIMVGDLAGGLEVADSVYVKDLQSRTSGFQLWIYQM